jgi:putative redox protein
MEVTVQHLGDVQFEIRARQNSIISDQPVENGGSDAGMTPPELLLASLASCAAYYAVDYLRKHDLYVDGVNVKLAAAKEKNPPRLDHFELSVAAPRELTPGQQVALERWVHNCLIQNTLMHPPSIRINVESAVPA